MPGVVVWPLTMPPLLHMYSAPSGPTAAPLGPPPTSATGHSLPSEPILVTRPAVVSTTRSEPSGIATGPSGNASPAASTSTDWSCLRSPTSAPPDQAHHYCTLTRFRLCRLGWEESC